MTTHRLPSSNSIREATGSAGAKGSRFEIVVIQEGLGNLKDAFFYTKEALESLCKVAEGKKIFANHPTDEEDAQRPERDVLKAFGHYENFRMQEGDGGRHEVVADLVVCEGAAFDRERGLLQHAVKYSEKYKNQDFVGVSILASGDSEEMGMDDLLKQGVAEGCMEKLSQAKDLGVDRVRLAKRFDDCTSIDLVTEAGAGGRIAKMLESQKEKTNMAKAKSKENEGTDPANKDGGVAPAGGAHPDKDQDVQLVKSMLDKYHGKDGKPGEEAEEVEAGKKLKAAYEAAKKMGFQGAEAEEAAVKHVQMAKHMQAEEAEEKKEAEKKEADEKAKKEAEEKKEAEKKEAEEKAKKEAEGCGSKEAASKIVSLTSENSALKEKLAKIELDSHIDKTLAESKAPMSATKKFREAIGTVKSKDEFDRLFSVFQKTREATLGGEASGTDFSEAYANPEREVVIESDSGSECSFEGAIAD